MNTSSYLTHRRYGALLFACMVICCGVVTPPVAAVPDTPPATAQAAGSDAVRPGVARHKARMRVHAHTLGFRPASEALPLVRPFLSPNGTVEEQPGGNTLVIRDTPSVIGRIVPVLERFDQPPEDLRFEIQIVRAGPRRGAVSPPQATEDAELSGEIVDRLRELLRYEDYRVLAEAAVTSTEGQRVTYSLGQNYSVSFRLGSILGGSQVSGERLRLEDFRILKHTRNPANKGRQLEPKELFSATLNLWIDRPFNLVLTQDASRQEALMVAISCHREGEEEAPDASDP